MGGGGSSRDGGVGKIRILVRVVCTENGPSCLEPEYVVIISVFPARSVGTQAD
jgi:hypothetical protein